MSPSLQTMGFFMSDINFCNTKEQLNHLGEVVTGKVDGSPTGADIDTSTLPYTGQVRRTLPSIEAEYEQSITDKEVEADAAIDSYRLLNKGPYASGITLESKFEYITYNGESYFATNPPYTTTATTPDNDGNLFISGYLTEQRANTIAIARSLNVGESQVVDQTETTKVLDDVIYIYDTIEQTTWVKPSDVGIGETIVNVVGEALTTNVGIYIMTPLLSINDMAEINVKDWGAKADDGVTNNTPIFRAIRDFIVSRGGNTTVIFPQESGAYVYEQHGGGTAPETPYYGMSDIFDFVGLENIIFRMNHAKIKLADGTRFGSFDPVTGVATGTQTEGKYANGGGRFIYFNNCKNYDVLNPNWDGNVSNHIIGGPFGDTGYQIVEYGVELRGAAENVNIGGGELSHSGLDGFAIGIENSNDLDNPNINIVNLKSEYNGRQGLSFTGGSNINFLNCSFSKTGRDTISSPPRAGIDIEPEGGRLVTKNKFFNCHMHDCAGAGLLTANSSVNMYDNDFIDCSFIGTTSTPLFLTSASGKVPVRFTRSHIKGAVSIVGNGQFFNCKFDDEATAEYPTIFTQNYFFENGSDLSIQDGCTYKVTQPSMPLFFGTKGIRNAKVYPAWDTDIEANSILGNIGSDYSWGSVEIYDQLTGSSQVPVYEGSAVLGRGSVAVIENNGLIQDAPLNAQRDNCPDYRLAAVKPLVTGLLITAQQNERIERQNGPMQVTVELGEPTSGNYQDGDIIFKTVMSPSGTAGFACTTGGVAGSTAVFKSFGTIGA